MKVIKITWGARGTT